MMCLYTYYTSLVAQNVHNNTPTSQFQMPNTYLPLAICHDHTGSHTQTHTNRDTDRHNTDGLTQQDRQETQMAWRHMNIGMEEEGLDEHNRQKIPRPKMKAKFTK